MEANFWHDRWTNGEIGFHQAAVNPYLGYYYGEKGPDISKREAYRVFVPLCGKSLDLRWLSLGGYSVIGVEVSPIAIRDFFTEQALDAEITKSNKYQKHTARNIEILEGDFFQLEKTDVGKITDVYDRASLVALPSELQEEYVNKITQLQDTGTRTLLVTMTYPQNEMDGPPFSVSEARVEELYGSNYKIDKLCVKDILNKEDKFKEQGLTSLTETVYKLVRE